MAARPTTYYIATRPDGTVPPTCYDQARQATARGETVPTINLADRIGQIVNHPSPGQRWHTDKVFSYFHTYTAPGEILETIEEGWPIRLWIAEPLGETGNPAGSRHPYWLMTHQLRVVQETEAWRAFGHRGARVLAVLAQLSDAARQWATEWATDPHDTRRAYAAWTQRVHVTHALDWWAYFRAQYSRRAAARTVADQLADTAATQAATAAGADPEALAAIRLRARCLIAGELLHDRIHTGDYEKEIRALLLGTQLNASVPA